jgi:tetratricopeptide (TPR) repeat protein
MKVMTGAEQVRPMLRGFIPKNVPLTGCNTHTEAAASWREVVRNYAKDYWGLCAACYQESTNAYEAAALKELEEIEGHRGLGHGREADRLMLSGRLEKTYLEQMDLKQLTWANMALAMWPNDAEEWNKKGEALLALRHCEEALAAFDRALLLTPSNARLWLLKGQIWRSKGGVYCKIGSNEAALNAYLKAIETQFEGQKRYDWISIGDTLCAIGNRGKAANAFEQALLSREETFCTNDEILKKKHSLEKLSEVF